jgi:hypothetical protein
VVVDITEVLAVLVEDITEVYLGWCRQLQR